MSDADEPRGVFLQGDDPDVLLRCGLCDDGVVGFYPGPSGLFTSYSEHTPTVRTIEELAELARAHRATHGELATSCPARGYRDEPCRLPLHHDEPHDWGSDV